MTIDVGFLAPEDVRLDKLRPKLLPGFRVLQTRGCETAFRAPVAVEVSGQMVRGAKNTVAVVADALVMKRKTTISSGKLGCRGCQFGWRSWSWLKREPFDKDTVRVSTTHSPAKAV